MTKYHAQATIVDGIRFPSKREAKWYADMKYAKMAGEVKWFLMQVPFLLPGNVKYLLDFMVLWKNGLLEFIDVKGVKTDVYVIKKKQVEALYGITIAER